MQQMNIICEAVGRCCLKSPLSIGNSDPLQTMSAHYSNLVSTTT